MAVHSRSRKRARTENSVWYFALFTIFVAAFIIWAILNLRIGLFTEMMKKGEAFPFLFVLDDGENPVLAEAVILHPVTKNAALVNIPKETGTLLSAVDRVDRLESLYNSKNESIYTEAVSDLIGEKIQFVFHQNLDEFERFVDFLGGVDLFIPKAIDEFIHGVHYLFPPGGVRLDGAKTRSYIEYRPDGELPDERTEREHRVVQALFRRLADSNEIILSNSVYSHVKNLIHTNLDSQEQIALLKAIGSLNTEQIVFQGILGTRRTLDNQEVLFPYYDGKLIKETVQRIEETLSRSIVLSEDLQTIQVEILNGTTVNGLASRTAQIYRTYGFRIASVSNADRNDYERTIVLDRQGNPDGARSVADLIRCGQIYSRVEENRDQTVDVTIILGRDFDGRYISESY